MCLLLLCSVGNVGMNPNFPLKETTIMGYDHKNNSRIPCKFVWSYGGFPPLPPLALGARAWSRIGLAHAKLGQVRADWSSDARGSRIVFLDARNPVKQLVKADFSSAKMSRSPSERVPFLTHFFG